MCTTSMQYGALKDLLMKPTLPSVVSTPRQKQVPGMGNVLVSKNRSEHELGVSAQVCTTPPAYIHNAVASDESFKLHR